MSEVFVTLKWPPINGRPIGRMMDVHLWWSCSLVLLSRFESLAIRVNFIIMFIWWISSLIDMVVNGSNLEQCFGSSLVIGLQFHVSCDDKLEMQSLSNLFGGHMAFWNLIFNIWGSLLSVYLYFLYGRGRYWRGPWLELLLTGLY